MTDERKRNPVLDRLGRVLERVLERALALDPQTRSQIAALEGARACIDLQGTGLALAITASEGRLVVGPAWERDADMRLRASPGSLIAFALRRGDDAPLPPGRVDISGDAELARRIERLLRGFRPDVEEAFAQAFGDVLGVPLARGLRAAAQWTRGSAAALLRDGAEFLRDDTRDLVAPAEIDAFLDDVDATRERVDRLAARVAALGGRGGGA